jgi:hypothetical protein
MAILNGLRVKCMTNHNLSEKDYNFLHRLTEVDFGPIAFKLTHPEEGMNLSIPEVISAIEQYRRFLFIYHLHPDRTIVPSKEIDLIWHTHILDTAKYREDCDWLFGHFIDHWPYFGLADVADRAALEKAFAETQALYGEYFRLLEVSST